jgi:DNA-directed RNA polymerase specialized sigma24 family protein
VVGPESARRGSARKAMTTMMVMVMMVVKANRMGVMLCLVEGYKYNEISEALNEPLGTIKSRIHFARKILKQKIERY